MVGKYLYESCLQITEIEAVRKLDHLLDKPIPTSFKVKCNKSDDERAAFLSKFEK